MTPKKENPKEAGRHWFDAKTEEDEKRVLAKLEEAAAIDASLSERLFYANISKDSYYRYLKAHPEFRDRLEALKNKPVLKARKRVVEGIDESYNNAMDYLKRKKKDEFSERHENTGADGDPLMLPVVANVYNLHGEKLNKELKRRLLENK